MHVYLSLAVVVISQVNRVEWSLSKVPSLHHPRA
jgi:hypothetical protein